MVPHLSSQAPPTGTIERWCVDLVLGKELAGKLEPGPVPDLALPESWESGAPVRRLDAPGRPPELEVVTRSPKTPKGRALADPAVRARLMHTFLHHELQAAELFAWALLAFPDTPKDFRRGLVRLCLEELEHLELYRGQLQRLGVSYGDHPVRDWFWERVPLCREPLQFVALMGMGLEAANLEHCLHFSAQLRAVGDEESAAVLDRVEREEVGHVAFGVKWFRTFSGGTDFESWSAALPAPITPSLLQGRTINRKSRVAAGMDEDFLTQLRAAPSTNIQSQTVAGSPVSQRPLTQPRAWVLNFDAEHELEARSNYAPSKRLLSILKTQATRLQDSLLRPGDIVLVDGEPPDPGAVGLPGMAWCMTPRARAQLLGAGALPAASPDVEILRRVNARPFASEVRAELLLAGPTGAFEKHHALDLDRALARIALPAENGWLVRRTFGAAGRGRRRIYAGRPTPAEEAWL
ncbi:MAG: uncharacterized ferritin-like protein (DUF455 family), partial [Planctomycetota bacterium]